VFIRPGYQKTDFREASASLNTTTGNDSNSTTKQFQVPACITSTINKPDSLKNAGIISIEEVLLAGRHLYYFRPMPNDKNKNCYDCATSIAFYDSACMIAVRFSVGGYAGVVAPAGFTRNDYQNRQKLRTLWTGGVVTSNSQSPARDPFPQPVSFIITEVTDSPIKVFKKDDELKISTADGLYHYRNGQIVNRYKIIPQKIKQYRTNPCLVPPCPTSEEEKIVYYLEPFQRYIYIEQLTDRAWFHISVKTFSDSNSNERFTGGDWGSGCRLKKK